MIFWILILAAVGFVAYMYTADNLETPTEGGTAAAPSASRCILPTLEDAKPAGDGGDDAVPAPETQAALISRTIESLDWLNQITKALWPHICEIVNKELGPTAEPLINAALPKPLKNFRFLRADLGHDYLVVDRVTVHKRFADSIAMDLDVSFKGKPDISMKVSPMGTEFGIEEMRWSGRLSVLMRPLTTTLPCVGAVQAAFVDHPEIYIDFTGVAAFADFGPVEKVVRKVLRDVIASMACLPNRFLFKLLDSVDFFEVYYPPSGALRVTICEGRGFIKEKKGFIKQTPDIYCKMKFGLEKAQTPVNSSLEPKWNTSHTFVLSDDDQPLVLTGWDDDTLKDDLLGGLCILASSLIENTQKWYSFTRDIDRVAASAEILLKSEAMSFSDNLSGPIMVTVLIDRAANLPLLTKYAQCKTTIGKREKPSAIIARPVEPIPGVDPVNPIFNMSWDVIVPTVSDANVAITLHSDKVIVGRIHFDGATLKGEADYTNEGVFQVGRDASLRCKVFLRGLVVDKPGTSRPRKS